MKSKLMAILLLSVLLTGCWDRKELNDIGIVGAIGFETDKNTGDILMTTQVVRPEALKRTDEGGGGRQPVEIVFSRGKTVFEAIRHISKVLDRKAFFAHNKVVVIDEQLAEEGIQDILDVLIRSQEMSRTVRIIIAKGSSTEEILGVKKGIEGLQSTYLNDLIRRKSINSESSAPELLEFIKKVSGKESNPVAGVMEVIEDTNLPAEENKGPTTKGIRLSGTAVFKKCKMVGYLDDAETRGLNWVTNKMESGIMNIPSPEDKSKLIAIEISNASSKVKPEMIDGNLIFMVEVKESGNLVEQQGNDDIRDMKFIERLEKAQEAAIKEDIDLAIKKIQKVYKSDVLDFGATFKRKYPKEWEKLKDNWDNIFPEVSYEVKVDAKITNTKLLQKPLNATGEEMRQSY